MVCDSCNKILNKIDDMNEIDVDVDFRSVKTPDEDLEILLFLLK